VKEFVLDASVALGWLADVQPSDYAARVQRVMVEGCRAVVPVHWHLEIANALVVGARRKVLRREMGAILQDLAALLPFVERDDLPDDIGALVGTCQREQLTAYDAAYIALAARRALPLATQDAAMAAAAGRLKIPLVK